MKAILNRKEIAENIVIKLNITEAKILLKILGQLVSNPDGIATQIYNVVDDLIIEAEKL